MICPYNRKSQKSVVQWVQTTEDGDGDKPATTTLEQIDAVSFEMMTCPKEGCAAWYNGRCHYGAASIENE